MTVVPFETYPHTEKRPCEWGPCGHCTGGHHDRCQFVRWPSLTSEPRRRPHTWILDRKGRVTSPHFPVYVTGDEVDWVCACHKAGHDSGGEHQLDLFGVAS